ncbi:MAG: type II secretion system protein [Candidatus Wildermuthbacteria bacterium]|nr:type II secretion system protein [Candidatus Wildermuthbacteria bacterium]
MRGFTIPELLISVFIIVLMTAITLPNWRTGETALALDRAAHTLSQNIRKATELAQRAQFYQCTTGSISGYGMYISSAAPVSYILYVECNGNDTYNAGSDAIFQTTTLENRIQITSATPSSFSAFFVPPVPTITIQPGGLTQAQVTLSVVGDPSRSKTITITTKGIIDID